MNEKIKNEMNLFTKYREGLDGQLSFLLLSDIIGHLAQEKDDKIDFSLFDEKVNEIKEVLQSVQADTLNGVKDFEKFKEFIKKDIEDIEKIQTECDYSLRTLTWVNSLLENKEEEKDA